MPEDASLEQRLSSTSPEALAALKGQLKRQKIVPEQEMKKMPYYKYQLTDLITGYFRRNEIGRAVV